MRRIAQKHKNCNTHGKQLLQAASSVSQQSKGTEQSYEAPARSEEQTLLGDAHAVHLQTAHLAEQGSAKIMAHRDACLYLALGSAFYFFGAGGCSGGALVIRPTANGTVGLFGSGFAWTLKL